MDVTNATSGSGAAPEAKDFTQATELSDGKDRRRKVRTSATEPFADHHIVHDIDAPYTGSVSMVPEYAQANAEYMREKEVKHRPLPNYIETVQKGMNSNMRAVLIDWLVEVADEYKVVTETLFLTVAYVDRFLSHRRIELNELQLLGVTCMRTAAKFEEIYPPAVEKFAFITDNACAGEDIIAAEVDVLEVLNYELSVPTPKVFLQRFLRAAHIATSLEYCYLESLARYILELSLLEYSMLVFRPSTVAAAALLLSRVLLAFMHKGAPQGPTVPHVVWTKTLEHYTFHAAKELEGAVLQLHRVLMLSQTSDALPAIREKYKASRWAAVSTLPFMPVVPPEAFAPLQEFQVPAEYLAHMPAHA